MKNFQLHYVLYDIRRLIMICGSLLFVISGFSCRESNSHFAKRLTQIFKKESINKDKINWDEFGHMVHQKATQSKDSAIVLALTLNKNPHSYYKRKNKILLGRFDVTNTDTCLIGKRLDLGKLDEVGYVKVKTFFNEPGKLDKDPQEYVNDILGKIKANDRKKLPAWIIDLRGNRGGDMWPMLISLTPFFTKSDLGYFQIGKSRSKWLKINDEIYLENDSQNDRLAIPPISYKLKNLKTKVAVLIDGNTGSSGEAVAIALKSLPYVKFFGTKTYGFATANKPINMGGDEYLILTTGTMADYSGKEYLNGIVPDCAVCSYEELEKSVNYWLSNGTYLGTIPRFLPRRVSCDKAIVR